MVKNKRYSIDEKLDNEIDQIGNIFRNKGFKNISKPEILRILIKDYKDRKINPYRKSKSNQWEL